MSRLTRDGTTELVSRDQVLRRERGQGNIMLIFLVQRTTSRIGILTRLIPTLLYVMTMYSRIWIPLILSTCPFHTNNSIAGVGKREAHISSSMVTCKGSTRHWNYLSQPGKVANPACGQLNKEKAFILIPVRA